MRYLRRDLEKEADAVGYNLLGESGDYKLRPWFVRDARGSFNCCTLDIVASVLKKLKKGKKV